MIIATLDRDRLLDLLVRCELCGRYTMRIVARSEKVKAARRWKCVDERYDVWLCAACARVARQRCSGAPKGKKGHKCHAH